MSGSRLRSFLARHSKIGLDTSVFIYQVEGSQKYYELVNLIFEWLEGPAGSAVTSTVTMLELLVHPYRHSDPKRAEKMYSLVSIYPHLDWIPPTLHIADRAARLMAAHNLATADALQAATAFACGATALVSNDKTLQRVPNLEVIVLDQMLAVQ